jgi:ABC-type transporter Mla subunit MlaD
VRIGIDDEAWPLHRGTRAALRFGTTLGNGTRRVDLMPGPKSAPELPEDGILTTRDTVTPVEFDQLFDTFDAKTRASMQGLFANGADDLKGRAGQLREGLRRAAPAFETTGSLLADVALDEGALRTLVASGHRSAAVLAGRHQQISDLVDVASQTFDTFARNSAGIRASLDQFAPTLRDTRATLKRTDTSIGVLDGLMTDLKPGVRALKPLVATAGPASRELSRLAPQATATVRTLRRAAPDISAFLADGVPFAQRLQPALAQLGDQLQCVRPYAPEIAGWASNWSSWAKGYDNTSHYGRIKVVNGPTALTSYPPIATNAFLALTGNGLSYAMPRPPGLNADQPWFIPECGYGKDALDPSKDPEDR